MERLWPEAEPAAARRDFRVALHALSEALEPGRARNTTAGCIERREDVYTFRPEGETWLDVAEFESLVQRGKAARDPAQAASLWTRALRLYSGDLLSDFPYQEWCNALRERMRRLYLETAEKLAHLQLKQRRDEEAAQTAHAMLARDRCWEEAYRILMRVNHNSGRTFMVTRLYEQCSQALKEELGVLPADETEALYLEATEG